MSCSDIEGDFPNSEGSKNNTQAYYAEFPSNHTSTESRPSISKRNQVKLKKFHSRPKLRKQKSIAALSAIMSHDVMDKHPGLSPQKPFHHQSDYDRLRDQCDAAMKEIETLGKKHADTLSRFEKTSREMEYHKKQHTCLRNSLEELQSNYEQVIHDRNKLRQDYEEIVLLREAEMSSQHHHFHERTISSSSDRPMSPRGDPNGSRVDVAFNFDEIRADRDVLSTKCKTLQEEKSKLKLENEQLKNRCTSAIQGFEKALNDREKTDHEYKLVKQECDKIKDELQETTKLKNKMSHELKKLQEDKNSVLQEYKLVMSERATVLQEIQELQENLGQTKDKAQELNIDKEKAFREKEGFQREIQSVLADRDKARHELRLLEERLERTVKEREDFSRRCETQTRELEITKQETNAAKKERREALVYRDKILKECFDVKQNFEELSAGNLVAAETLKDKFDKLSKQLTDAWNRTEVAMARRNWAFNERDKVVKERENMRDRYSSLAKDKTLIEEQCKKLSLEMHSSQKKFKELYRENESLRKTLLVKGSMLPSQDSAIDTEAPSYQICGVKLEKSAQDEFGFKIGGGMLGDKSITVVEVTPGSLAENHLKVNDLIIQVNNMDMTNVDYETACESIFGVDDLDMKILRHNKVGLKNPLQRFDLKTGNDEKAIGLSIDSGFHIKSIEPGSAAEEETLSIGDKILTINGQSIDDMPYQEAKKLLNTSHLSLTVLKPSVSTTSSHRSLSHRDDRDDEKVADNTESDSMTSNDGPLSSRPPHFRSPSAPGHIGSPDFSAFHHSSMFGGPPSHPHKSMNFLNKMSDEEIKRVLSDLTDEQRRREREQLEMIDESKPQRSPSFISAIRKSENYGFQRPSRPRSTNSITNSINSSGSTGRTMASPLLNPTRSDPLALDPMRTLCQPSSATTSSTSVNSLTHRGRRTQSQPRHAAMPHTWTGPPPKIPHSSENLNPSYSIGHEHSSSLYARLHHPSMEFSDRHTIITSHSTVPSKQGSSRSVGGPGHSSHGSLNSDFSENPAPIHVAPVYEEELESPFTEDYASVISGTRRSSRASSKPDFSSPASSKKSVTTTTRKRSVVRATSDEEEPRRIIIEKGMEPLGITILEGDPNGIFVSHVTEGSYAAKHGLKYGDQLLEFNGINLRTAEKKQAETILTIQESTVTVLVHYNPSKMPIENSRTPIPENESTIGDQRPIHIDRVPASTALGLGIIGGNHIGIFISDIQKGSLASQSNLRCGDQILKYNDKDMGNITLEEAILELGKHTEVSDLQVQYNPPGYRKAQTQANDSFYVRAQFDRFPHGKGELSFRKGDILHVTETFYKGQLGVWRASIVNDNETTKPSSGKLTKGKIPSKRKAEQELLLRRSSSYGDDKSKNRKSLFRRSKKGSSHHAINHSRESSDSKAEIESTVSGGTSFVFISDDFNTYQFVKQLECKFPRPVIIVGPMAEPICDKLVIHWSMNFARCFEVVHSTQDEMSENVDSGTYLDYKLRKGGDRYEVVTANAVKEFSQKQTKHCLLDINMDAIERIINAHLYPIIIYLKFKSGKIIKDMRDGHFIKDKLSTKEAKDLYDTYLKQEKDSKHFFNVTINAVSNLHQVCKDINDAVLEQQKKALWVNNDE
ncbi:disks large homolog 5-like isoform X2 [Clytia hemisphaerica]|uniref:disks large homolog 5-like isoform X2 n=1 Tax=Clytia hemisphaerica TaxID=252671 RepID=UPI0034D6ADC8